MITIVGDFQFLHGGAPAERLGNIAAALAQCGHAVRLVALSRTHLTDCFGEVPVGKELQARGVRAYAWLRSGETDRRSASHTRIRWLWETYVGALRAASKMLRQFPTGRDDVYYLYGRSYLKLYPFLLSARRTGAITVWDATEGVERFSGLGGFANPVFWDWSLGVRLIPRRVDLVAAISSGLADRARKAGARLVMLLPGVEDWSQPMLRTPAASGRFRLFVFGALLPKDAPDLLCRVVSELAKRRVRVSIELVGRYDSDPSGRQWCQRILSLANESTVVCAHGAPAREALQTLLAEAEGFLMLRPDTTSERLAFPTRMIELLKYGRPMMVSDVGDVGRYLGHQTHALLLPDDAEKIADMIYELISRPDRGHQMGERGRLQGAVCFDRMCCVKRLVTAIEEIRYTGETSHATGSYPLPI